MRRAQIVKIKPSGETFHITLNDGYVYLVGSPKMMAFLKKEPNLDVLIGRTLILGDSNSMDFAPANLEKIQAAAPEMLQALKNAREMIQFWGSYVGEYFREERDLVEDLAAIDNLIARIEGE